MSGVYEKNISYVIVKFWETGAFDYLITRKGDEDYQAALKGAEVWDYVSTEEQAQGTVKFLNKRSA